jgi:hypothetical protein
VIPFADMPSWLGWLLVVGAGLLGLFLIAALATTLVILARAARRRSS